ncbi:MAG: hypothetical protein ACOZQL_23350 [Myxococcota bacterium]
MATKRTTMSGAGAPATLRAWQARLLASPAKDFEADALELLWSCAGQDDVEARGEALRSTPGLAAAGAGLLAALWARSDQARAEKALARAEQLDDGAGPARLGLVAAGCRLGQRGSEAAFDALAAELRQRNAVAELFGVAVAAGRVDVLPSLVPELAELPLPAPMVMAALGHALDEWGLDAPWLKDLFAALEEQPVPNAGVLAGVLAWCIARGRPETYLQLARKHPAVFDDAKVTMNAPGSYLERALLELERRDPALAVAEASRLLTSVDLDECVTPALRALWVLRRHAPRKASAFLAKQKRRLQGDARFAWAAAAGDDERARKALEAGDVDLLLVARFTESAELAAELLEAGLRGDPTAWGAAESLSRWRLLAPEAARAFVEASVEEARKKKGSERDEASERAAAFAGAIGDASLATRVLGPLSPRQREAPVREWMLAALRARAFTTACAAVEAAPERLWRNVNVMVSWEALTLPWAPAQPE